MGTLAVQYLERPYLDATPESARVRLCQAFDQLPISLVLLGWELSPLIEESIAKETSRLHVPLYRWQPLLVGDANLDLPLNWTTIGCGGNSIYGYNEMPEFTFLCPNQSAVADFLSERVELIAERGLFQGIFLDRIRYPSPTLDPLRDLACFCPDCTSMAADIGLDLNLVRRTIFSLPPEIIVRSLLGQPEKVSFPFESFLDFRFSSITRIVRTVSKQAHSHNLAIGLDCFSPVLTRMVGQDLSALNSTADWVKIMTYPRVFNPAGIPFELFGLAKFLNRSGMREMDTMRLLAESSCLSIPTELNDLRYLGLGSETISREIQRGYEMGVTTLLAGVPLVRLENIHESTPEQIFSDLKASHGADGLVISWDLWLTPFENFDHIRAYWS